MNVEKMFEDLKKNEVKRTEESSKQGKSGGKLNEDPRFIHFKSGNTYRMRLLFFVPEGSKRKTPFINKYTHSFYNEDARSLNWVVCPTSEYIFDRKGFKECKICDACSKFYHDGKNAGDSAAMKMYSTFKRRFNGFVAVYVISDPSNEENNNTIKIMRYGITINRFFKSEIFGIDDKEGKVLNIDTIGADAFKLDKGYDLIVTVGKNITEDGEFNSYDCKFARQATKVNISESDIDKALEELKFDKDFFEFSTKDDILNFYNKFVLRVEVEGFAKKSEELSKPEVAEEIPEVDSLDVPDDLKVLSSSTSKPSSIDDNDINVDELLKSIEGNY